MPGIFVRWLMAVAVVALVIHDGGERAHTATIGYPEVYAAYVLLAPGGDGDSAAVFARVIVDVRAKTCPQLLGGRAPIAMTFRANPHGFDVKVCEAPVPFEQPLRVSWDDVALPPAVRKPSRILVMGDTGCEARDCPGDGPARPFDRLAADAAGEGPLDLIIHVGDYNYRGTKDSVTDKNTGRSFDVYDAGDNVAHDPECRLDAPYVSQNAGFSVSPDDWKNWQSDFFDPARPLLSKAPWIFTRGNHELCSRAGPGWFYFLDSGASARLGGSGQLACPPQGGRAPPRDDALRYLEFTEPQVINLADLRVVVIDSANACDRFAPKPTTAIYAVQLERVLETSPRDKTIWLVSHRPFWGIVSKKPKNSGESTAVFGSAESSNRTLQSSLRQARAASGNMPLPNKLGLVLSGHIHTFEALTFLDAQAGARPPQLIVGNSGVALDRGVPEGTFNARIDGALARFVGVNEHGLLIIDRFDSNGSWSGSLVNAQGGVLARCAAPKPHQSLCTRGDAPKR